MYNNFGAELVVGILIYVMLPATLGSGVYSISNRNE
jgi:hypothetical protein